MEPKRIHQGFAQKVRDHGLQSSDMPVQGRAYYCTFVDDFCLAAASGECTRRAPRLSGADLCLSGCGADREEILGIETFYRCKTISCTDFEYVRGAKFDSMLRWLTQTPNFDESGAVGAAMCSCGCVKSLGRPCMPVLAALLVRLQNASSSREFGGRWCRRRRTR